MAVPIASYRAANELVAEFIDRAAAADAQCRKAETVRAINAAADAAIEMGRSMRLLLPAPKVQR